MKLISKIFMALAFMMLLPINSNAAVAVSTTPVNPIVSKTEYKKAFSVFGILILTIIPTFVYFIPGILYYLTGNLIIQWIG
jgi:hypothetical protein